MSKVNPEKTTAIFIYDKGGNMVSGCTARVAEVPGGVAWKCSRFVDPETAQKRFDELKEVAPNGEPLGWLWNSSGQVRALIIPHQEFAAGDLLLFLDATEKCFFDEQEEDGLTISVKPNAARS